MVRSRAGAPGGAPIADGRAREPRRSPTILFAVVDPDSAEAQQCLERYFAELNARFVGGFDVTRSIRADASGLVRPHGAFVVGRLEGRAVACGTLSRLEPGVCYLKRMWVDAAVRGQGLGRRLLEALEQRALMLGYHTVRLETNRALVEAIRLYRRSDYVEVRPFNQEYYAHHWFEKRIG